MSDSAQSLYQTAYSLHYDHARYEQALEVYQRVITEFPQSKQSGYARTQIQNIEEMPDSERKRQRERGKEFEEELARRREEFVSNREAYEAHMSRVMTVNPSRPYDVVAPVFTIGQAESGTAAKIISGLFGAGKLPHIEGFKGDPFAAFEYAVESLIEQCDSLQADAVVGCQFEHRVAQDSVGNQVFEVMGYGTAVRWIDRGESESK